MTQTRRASSGTRSCVVHRTDDALRLLGEARTMLRAARVALVHGECDRALRLCLSCGERLAQLPASTSARTTRAATEIRLSLVATRARAERASEAPAAPVYDLRASHVRRRT
jgi:hypothetical protein